MKEKREGGSVPGFIVAALILVGLLIGGAYFVQQQSHNKPALTPVPEKPGEQQKPAEESSTPPPANNAPQADNSSQNQSTHNLPQSGPSDIFIAVLAMGILTGTLASYIQSRRQLAPL